MNNFKQIGAYSQKPNLFVSSYMFSHSLASYLRLNKNKIDTLHLLMQVRLMLRMTQVQVNAPLIFLH